MDVELFSTGSFQTLTPVLGVVLFIAFSCFWLWIIGRAIFSFLMSIAAAAKSIGSALHRVPDSTRTIIDFVRKYPSVFGIVAVNGIPLAGVLWYGWEPFAVLFTYWLQTGFIGFFSFLKIKKVAEFSPPERQIRVVAFAVRHTKGAVPVSKIIRDYVGVYWFGMITSLLFLIFFTWFASIDTFSFRVLLSAPIVFGIAIRESFGVIVIGTASFLFNHGYSYFFNFVGKQEFLHSDLAAQLSDPIDRVGMIWGALFITGTTLVFIPYLTTVVAVLIIFKTMFDIYAHLKEHGRYFSWQYEYRDHKQNEIPPGGTI
ncbi:MAG: DUF6498-containing protein [bacterium]|nr:DUF6498-containing protein [bacterium]